jgi:hypothetical protein
MMPKEEEHHAWEDFGAPTSPLGPITSSKKTTPKIRSKASGKSSHRRQEDKSEEKKKRRQSNEKPETTNEKKKASKEKQKSKPKSKNSNIKSSRCTSKERSSHTKDLENSFSTSCSDQGRTVETLTSPVSQEKTTLKLIDADEAVIRSPAATTSRRSERGRRTILSSPSSEGKSSSSRKIKLKIKLKREKSNEDLPSSSSSPSTSGLEYQPLNGSEHQKSSTGANVASEETAGFQVTQTSGNISLWEMRQKFKRDFPSEPIPSDVVLRQLYKSDKLAVYDLRERYKKEYPGKPMLSNDDLQQFYRKPKEAIVGVERAHQSLERPPPLVALQREESVMTFATEATWEGYGKSVKKMETNTTKGLAIYQGCGEIEEEDLQLEPKEWQDDLHVSLELSSPSPAHTPTGMKHPDDQSDWATGHELSKNETNNVPTDAAWDKSFRDSKAVGEKATGTARDKTFHESSSTAKPKSGIDLLEIPSNHFPSAKDDVAFGTSFLGKPPSSDPSTRETLTRSSIDLLATESDRLPTETFAKSSTTLLAAESNRLPTETFGRSSIELLEVPSDHLERFCDETSAKEHPSDINFQEATIELMEIASKHARKKEATTKDTAWDKDFHESMNSMDFLAEMSTASDDKNEGSWLDYGEGTHHNSSRRSNERSQHRKPQQRISSYSDLKTSSKSSERSQRKSRRSLDSLEDDSRHGRDERSQRISRRTVEGDTLDEDEPLNVNKRGEKSQRRSRRSVDPEYENAKTSTRASERSQRKPRRSVSVDTFEMDEFDIASEMSQWKGLGLFEEEVPSSRRGVSRTKSEPLGKMSSRTSDIIRGKSDRKGDDDGEGFATFETTEEGLQNMLRLDPSKLDASSSPRRSASRDRIREKSAQKRKEGRKVKFVPGVKTRRSEDTVATAAPPKSPTAKRPTKAASNHMALAGTWMSDVPSMLIQRPEVVVGRSETVSPLTAATKKGIPMISRRRFATPNL